MADEVRTIVGQRLIQCSPEWWDWMKRVGIAEDGDKVSRVIIDLAVNRPVRIYVQKSGTNKLDIAPPTITLDGKPAE